MPQLGNATEHAEHAAAALRLAQDAIAAYLAALGPVRRGRARRRTATGGPALDDADGAAGARTDADQRPAAAGRSSSGPWWQRPGRRSSPARRRPPGRGRPAAAGRPADTAELLRRVAAGVRSGDRARLGRDLHAVNAATGLGLSAVAPPVLRRLAGDLLGHEPRPEDLPRLRARGGRPGPVAAARHPARRAGHPAGPDLPGAGGRDGPAHPADSAVTAERADRRAAGPAGPRPGDARPARPRTAATPPTAPSAMPESKPQQVLEVRAALSHALGAADDGPRRGPRTSTRRRSNAAGPGRRPPPASSRAGSPPNATSGCGEIDQQHHDDLAALAGAAAEAGR